MDFIIDNNFVSLPKISSFVKNLSIILMVVAASLICGCEKTQDIQAPEEAKPIVLTRAQEQAVSDINAFSLNLFNKIYENELASEKDKNCFFSPYSISQVLAMLLSGAEGPTFDGLSSVLDLKGMDIEAICELYKELTSSLLEADPSVQLNIANKLWVKPSYYDLIKPEYNSRVSKYFNSSVGTADFSTDEGIETINRWCSNETNGMIYPLFDNPVPLTEASVANAMYFSGSWRQKFDNTEDVIFYPIDGEDHKVKMMTDTRNAIFRNLHKISYLSLPYGNGAFNMEFIMPHENFEDFCRTFSSTHLKAFRSDVVAPDVKIKLPMFEQEFAIKQLLKILQTMGANISSEGFSKIMDGGLGMDTIVHKAKVSVTKTGTVAAAATATKFAGSVLNAPPVEIDNSFIANRPFIYLISESSTGAVLFIGTYTK